jgi:sphingomyelin phosphodiesterase acid-like 3
VHRKLWRGSAAQTLLACFVLTVLVAAVPGHSAPAQSKTVARNNVFLIAADIHFNPMADPALVPQLEAAEPSQWESILVRSKRSAYSQYGEDTNWWLLQSALGQMQKTLPHPAFLLVMGDSLAHRFPSMYQSVTHDGDREHYRKFVLRTMDFLGMELRKRFPGTKIFVTPGNNDEECGNYSVEPGGRFLHDTADLVRDLALGKDELRGSWEMLGSFDVPHPTVSNLRLISLNTVFFSDKYQAKKFSEGCKVVPSDAAAQQFSWLESRLQRAKEAHQKVWLMLHIPPGIDPFSTLQQYQTLAKNKPGEDREQLCSAAIVPMWVPSSTAKFDELLEKYRGIVTVSFAGHTHVDDFRVMRPGERDSHFVIINPAVSPIYRQNPAFRTVSFSKDGSLLDSTVYYLTNLIYASSTTPGEWQREYSFDKQWKTQRIDAAVLASLYDKLKSDEDVRSDWIRLYNVSSSAAFLPTGNVSGAYCATEALTPQAYTNCYCPGEAGYTPSGR